MTTRTAKYPVFALRLAQARERSGLSQTQLGVLAGLDPAVASPTINQYERGKHEPQLKRAKRLAEVLGIPPAFLYTEDDLLAELLLQWNGLSLRKKKELVTLLEANKAPKAKISRSAAEYLGTHPNSTSAVGKCRRMATIATSGKPASRRR